MRQRIVNLTLHEVIDPKDLGAPSSTLDDFALFGSPVMGALIWALTTEKGWRGDRIAIVGEGTVTSDAPHVESLSRIRAGEFYAPSRYGHVDYVSFAPEAREALRTEFGYSFDAEPDLFAHYPEPVEAKRVIEAFSEPFVVLNETKGQLLNSMTFSPVGGLGHAVLNPGYGVAMETPVGLLPTALAALLSISWDKGSSRVLGPSIAPWAGSWAGDNISIASADTGSNEDISGNVLQALLGHSPLVAQIQSSEEIRASRRT